MYIPAWFHEENRAVLHDLMRQFSFATLVTQTANGASELFASHLPFLLNAETGEQGTLRAHLALANPQWRDCAGEHEVLVVFQGPHAYISPAWVVKHPSVPTWNYAVVHAYGIPRLLSHEELLATLEDTVTLYESGFAQPWTMEELSANYVDGMARGIVGIEIALTRLEGKFKLSQNRSEADRAGIITHLRQSGHASDVETADWMQKEPNLKRNL